MVCGTDEHGTPILVQADAEGVTAAGAGRPLQPGHRRGPARPRACPTTCSPGRRRRNHYAVAQELFRGLHRERLHLPEDHAGRDLAVDRPHPARPLHRGHLPDLRLRRRPRRPVRQLRQPARPDRPDQPASAGSTARRRSSSRPSTSSSTCRRSPRRSATWLQTRERLAAQRAEVLASTCSTTSSRGRSPATSTGASRSRCDGWRDRPDKRIYVWFDAVIGYLSASIEWARRTGDPEAWRQWWQTPDADAVLLHGQGQHRLPLRDLAGELLGYNGEGDKGGTPGLARRAEPADRGGLQRVPDHGGPQVLLLAAASSSTSRDFLARYDADALRYFIAVAGPENQDTDFTWAEFLRRNNDELVAGWGNLVNRSVSMAAQELRRDPGGRRADRRRPRAAGAAAGGVRHASATCSARTRQKAGDQRGDAGRRRGEQVPLRPGAVEAQDDGPGADGAPSCTSRCRWSTTATRCSRRSCRTPRRQVHELLGGTGVWSRRCRRSSEVDDLDGGPAVPGHHRRLRRRQARWASHAARRRARRSRPPTPVFTKLDPSIVDEELARLERRVSAVEPATAASRRRPGAAAGRRRCDSHCHLDIAASGRPRRHRRARRRPTRVDAAAAVGDRAAGAGRRRRCRRPAGRRTLAAAAPERARRGRAPPQRGAAAAPGRRSRRLAEIDALAALPAGAGGRRDRARLLPHRRRGPGGAGGVVPRAHRASPRRTARRWSSTTATRTTTCCASSTRRARRSAWSSTASPATPSSRGAARTAAAYLSLRRHRHVQERRDRCATRPRWRRWTCCWSRPTRRSSPRCRTAAGPTRRTSCRSRCARWPRSAATTSTSCARRRRQHRARLRRLW